jgi:hypothetical protein
MSWLYSRALVAEYSAGLSLDGEPSALSKSSPIPQAYLPNDRMTAFSRLSRFGMTFAPLTENHGAELLTLYLAAFPARTSAQREEAQALRASAPVSGKNTPGLLAKFDRDSSSWKTVHSSLFGDSMLSSVIFPRWGMTLDGALYQRPTPALRTCGKESGLWPTPKASDGERGGRGDLIAIVRGKPNSHSGLWPTPRTAGMCGGTGNWNQLKDKCENIEEARKMGAGIGGQLNPTWVEWLMGWPLGWTDLKPLGTDKFRQWLESHGKSLQMDKEHL